MTAKNPKADANDIPNTATARTTNETARRP
jgi:hypothetical protein